MTYQPNVLLLDQDHVLRRATALLLCNRGALVSPAATLDDAISLSRERVYDVALIDLAPGTKSAREILGRLRREGTMPRRVVFCADEPVSCDGADDVSEVLLKPYAFGRLLSTIFVDLGAPPSTKSGVFPRLRLVRGDLGKAERSGPGERGVRAAGGVALEAAVRPVATRAASVEARADAPVETRGGAVVRLQRRTRSGPSGRTVRSTRRAPRGARHPG
ncbi:response regulator [Sorangium cellulosum]|uniref:Two component response regulator n=1 Tax=Sorangium cellulosum TaxID=56 RepID=A0A150QKC4_SORCE|nr:response regulator [Sorangium cellulosum]KYF68400.1 two component response regulator [Sorangium cellulosum]